MISKILFLIKQIRPRTPQINDLWTPITVLLESCAFEAIECVRNAFAAADYTLVLVVAEGALVADADEGCRPHIGIADGTFAITFVAETTDCYARLLAAHNEIGMMARHGAK